MEITLIAFRVYKNIYSFSLFYPMSKTTLIVITLRHNFLSLSVWQSVDNTPIVSRAVVKDNLNG